MYFADFECHWRHDVRAFVFLIPPILVLSASDFAVLMTEEEEKLWQEGIPQFLVLLAFQQDSFWGAIEDSSSNQQHFYWLFRLGLHEVTRAKVLFRHWLLAIIAVSKFHTCSTACRMGTHQM